MKLIAKYIALLISVLIIFGMLCYFYILPDRLDPQGVGSASCFVDEFPVIPNGNGMLASAHHTLCDDVVHDSAIYVFVYKSGGSESPHSLVFRYADYPTVAPPKIEWVDKSTLSISVGDVSQVTKMLTFVEGVKIVYSIGKEEYPRDAWQKHVDTLKIFSALVFVLMLGLIYACKKLLFSILRHTVYPSAK
jgi:hypothetical protein